MKYLFVCTGNTCRSPMAEAVMAQRVGKANVRSAGVAAVPGIPTAAEAAGVLATRGIVFSGTSKAVTEEEIAWADRIVGLERHHVVQIVRRFPDARSKSGTLGDWAGEPEAEIDDPIGGSIADYSAACDEIERLIARMIARQAASGP